jgi:uncharacterized protein (DUF849 family)
LHLHARDPKDGRPSPDPKVFQQFLPRIKQSCDAVINITTGGSVTMTLEDRLAAAETFSPEMCSLNMGSMNFALYPMAKRYKNWKYGLGGKATFSTPTRTSSATPSATSSASPSCWAKAMA